MMFFLAILSSKTFLKKRFSRETIKNEDFITSLG